MINVMDDFLTDVKEYKAITAERIDKIEHLLWENVTGHNMIQTIYQRTSRVITK